MKGSLHEINFRLYARRLKEIIRVFPILVLDLARLDELD